MSKKPAVVRNIVAGRDLQLKDRATVKAGAPYPGFHSLHAKAQAKLLKLGWAKELPAGAAPAAPSVPSALAQADAALKAAETAVGVAIKGA